MIDRPGTPDDPSSPPDLLHDPLQRIVGPDLAPVAVRKAVIGQRLADALFNEIGRSCQALRPQVCDNCFSLFLCRLLIAL
jgi:hypothetical protein